MAPSVLRNASEWKHWQPNVFFGLKQTMKWSYLTKKVTEKQCAINSLQLN